MVLKTSLKIYLERNYRRLGALLSIEQLNGHNYNLKQKKVQVFVNAPRGFFQKYKSIDTQGF
jgi:hypothetical protein